MKKSIRELLALMCSIFCTCALSCGFLVHGSSVIQGRSFEALFFLFAFFVVCRYCFMITNFRKSVVAFIFSGILAVLVYIGAEFENYHTVLLPSWSLIASFFGLYFSTWCFFILAFRGIDWFREKKIKGEKNKIINRFNGNFKSFLLFWLVIILTWIPVFLAVFPGIYSYDASIQVLEIYGGWGLDSHHPVLHTLFFNGCLFLGDFLFNDFNMGVAIYSVVQGCILAAAFANICNKMIKYRMNKLIVIGSFIWFGFNPINQIFVFITTKDVLFTAFFIWCITMTIEMIIDNNFFTNRVNVCEFIISTVFMILLRNQGKYIFILFVIAGVLCFRNVRKKFLLISIMIIVITQVITGPISTMIGVQKGSIREALSVPIQQLARVYNVRPDYYDEDDLNILYGLIPIECWEAYEPEISDPVKSGFNNEYWDRNKIKLIKLWLKTGVDNFKLYIESFLYGSYGYWYVDSSPRVQAYIWFDGFFMQPEFNILNISRHSKFVIYEDYLRQISYNLIYEKIPIIAVVFNQGFPFWCMLIAAGYLIYNKQYRLLLALVWMFGIWGTILLGPVICVRYAYPLIAALPVVSIVVCIEDQTEKSYFDIEVAEEK